MLQEWKKKLDDLREVIKTATRMMFEIHELLWAVVVVVLVIWEMSRLFR